MPASCHRAVEMRGWGKGIPGQDISQSLSNRVDFGCLPTADRIDTAPQERRSNWNAASRGGKY